MLYDMGRLSAANLKDNISPRRNQSGNSHPRRRWQQIMETVNIHHSILPVKPMAEGHFSEESVQRMVSEPAL